MGIWWVHAVCDMRVTAQRRVPTTRGEMACISVILVPRPCFEPMVLRKSKGELGFCRLTRCFGHGTEWYETGTEFKYSRLFAPRGFHSRLAPGVSGPLSVVRCTKQLRDSRRGGSRASVSDARTQGALCRFLLYIIHRYF